MDQMHIFKAPEGVAADRSPVDPMARMSEVLTTQAIALDAMFTELMDYAAKRFEASPGFTERYMRLALRAQANCRASLEAVARADRARRETREDGGE